MVRLVTCTAASVSDDGVYGDGDGDDHEDYADDDNELDNED